MPKFPKNYQDVEYYIPGRKRKIAGSTKATSDFLVIIHQENPTFTIQQIRELITNRNKYILHPDAVDVLDAYIKAGYGDCIPKWK